MNPLDIYTVSRVRTWNTCPRQHRYRYVLGWTPIDKGEALSRGTRVHEQLAEVYRGNDKESSLAIWRWKHDDLEPVAPISASVERAIIPANLYPGGQLVAGVVDLVSINRTSGKFWITDHKSVERMYVYPKPYAIEQLGVYRTIVREEFALDFAGGCISRIVYKPDSSYQYSLGYILRNLKVSEGLSLTRTTIKQWEKLLLPKPARKPRGHVRWLRHRKRQRSLAFRKFDADGQMIKSLMYLGDRYSGALIHVERMYIPLEKKMEGGNWADFQASIETIDNESERRTPGFHCTLCPFNVICPQEQEKGLPAGSLMPAEGFEQRPANEEVLLALDRQNEV